MPRTDTLRLARDTCGDIILEADDRVCLRLTDDELAFILRVGPMLLDPVPRPANPVIVEHEE